MGQTVVEKLAQRHMVEGPSRPLKAGDMISLKPRHVFTHDNTSAVITKFRSIGAKRIHDPRQPVFVLDHDVQNRSEANVSKYRKIRSFAEEQGVDFYPEGTGIGHQIMVAEGYAVPGSLVVGSDSHSNIYGAVGALGTPVVRTDAAAIWATGEFWWQVPRTIQVVLEGQLNANVTGKDLIITLCGLYNQGEVLNAAIEFTGPGVAGLTMDSRLAIANMTTEWGALVGWFPVDSVTLEYMARRREKLSSEGIEDRITQENLTLWAETPPMPDEEAGYAARIHLDLTEITPQVAGPDSVQVTRSVAELAKERIVVHKAYLLSCVNGRLEDLEAAAAVLRGRKVAAGVELYLAAASGEIQQAAEASGAWSALVDAGARQLPPSCGPCIGLGAGLLEPGQVGISATNRNFKGRMGSRDAKAYLASPAVVAASAAAGFITGPEPVRHGHPEYRLELMQSTTTSPESAKVNILKGFPERIQGRAVFVPQDNLNTDGIYGKDYTYRELPADEMGRVVMENYDPGFSASVRPGDVLVGGWNFGTGSSREQAATALQACGIAMVIAGSFSDTYLRNAYNNGLICVACPDLVTRLKTDLADDVGSGKLTIIPGDQLDIDFAGGTITWRDHEFRFPPLGSVPQSLVVAGGVEKVVRNKLGLD